jgi:hypothetical protein
MRTSCLLSVLSVSLRAPPEEDLRCCLCPRRLLWHVRSRPHPSARQAGRDPSGGRRSLRWYEQTPRLARNGGRRRKSSPSSSCPSLSRPSPPVCHLASPLPSTLWLNLCYFIRPVPFRSIESSSRRYHSYRCSQAVPRKGREQRLDGPPRIAHEPHAQDRRHQGHR